jgi:esterase/lipase superfamily enzyme
MQFRLLLIFVCIATIGCQHNKLSRRLMPTPIGVVAGLAHPGGDFAEACQCSNQQVPVFVVAGRNVKPKKKSPDPFGNQRTQTPRLGIAYVTIGNGLTPEQLYEQTISPKKRKSAKVEFSKIELSPASDSLTLFKERESPTVAPRGQWFEAISRKLDNDPRRNITIFVHGYNTELIDNTLVAAEIFHYLGHCGAMISFEWPSTSNLFRYIQDKGNASFSTRHFRTMLVNLAKECSADSITIIAHSAGSPIVVNALRELRLLDDDLTAQQIQDKYKVSRVVLAAPDMDLMTFINAVGDRFHQVASRVAVYASPKDRALRFSEKLYGSQRLGRAVNNLQPWEKKFLMESQGIELIDASVAEDNYRSFLMHNYFHRDPWVSSDIGAFILGKAPWERNLTKETDDVFWAFPDDYPDQLRTRAALPKTINFSDDTLPLSAPVH